MTTRSDRIRDLLDAHFHPDALEVIDESAMHAGHAGAAPGGETHFRVRMTAASFSGQSRVARSRAVHSVLHQEFAGGLHALALSLASPDEHQTGPR